MQRIEATGDQAGSKLLISAEAGHSLELPAGRTPSAAAASFRIDPRGKRLPPVTGVPVAVHAGSARQALETELQLNGRMRRFADSWSPEPVTATRSLKAWPVSGSRTIKCRRRRRHRPPHATGWRPSAPRLGADGHARQEKLEEDHGGDRREDGKSFSTPHERGSGEGRWWPEYPPWGLSSPRQQPA